MSDILHQGLMKPGSRISLENEQEERKKCGESPSNETMAVRYFGVNQKVP